jgi:hypothetical protein
MNELLNYKNTSFSALSFVKSQSKIELFDYNFDQTNYISLMILDLMSKGQYGSLINQFTDEEVENIEKQIKDNTFVYEIPDPELSKMREISLEVLHHFTKLDENGFGIDFDEVYMIQCYLMKLYNKKEIFKAFSLVKHLFE